MRQDKKPMKPAKGGKPQSRAGARREREGTEGNNAIQSQPDDSKQTSMLDSGKHTEKSPYTAGSQ